MNRYHKLLLTLVLAASYTSGFAAKGFPPKSACVYMEQEGFRGSSEYHEYDTGKFRCNTLRKPVTRGEPPKSDVRYLVTGNASEGNRLALELRMRSSRGPQQVLILFSQYAAVLLENALAETLPDDVSTAIRTAVPGEWQLAGWTLKLARSHDRGSVYDLIFSIE